MLEKNTCCGGHSHTPKNLIAKAEEFCSANGQRLTAPRAEVLKTLARSHKALGAYDILEAVDPMSHNTGDNVDSFYTCFLSCCWWSLFPLYTHPADHFL